MGREGKIKILEYQRYGRNKATLINKRYIESGEYRSKFDRITNNSYVNRVLYQKAKEMLFHRSGTLLEDMYWIDMLTGTIIAKALNETEKNRICYSESINKVIWGRTNLIAMHTHPHSMPPSIADFNSAFLHNYFMGIVICHDGKIFVYNSKEEVSENLYSMYIEKIHLHGLEEYSAQIETLNKLKESYQIDYWEVKPV